MVSLPHLSDPYPGDLDDGAVTRSFAWGAVVGIPFFMIIVVSIVLLAGEGWGTALMIAPWPALVAGPYFGTLLVVDWAEHQHRLAPVRTLLHPRAALRAHHAHAAV